MQQRSPEMPMELNKENKKTCQQKKNIENRRKMPRNSNRRTGSQNGKDRPLLRVAPSPAIFADPVDGDLIADRPAVREAMQTEPQRHMLTERKETHN